MRIFLLHNFHSSAFFMQYGHGYKKDTLFQFFCLDSNIFNFSWTLIFKRVMATVAWLESHGYPISRRYFDSLDTFARLAWLLREGVSKLLGILNGTMVGR